jgi:uncharacterized protein with HEPN domain
MPLSLDDAELLADMRAAAMAAQAFVSGLTLQAYVSSELHSSAVERKLIVIGEAAGFVSSDLQRRHSHVHWDLITGLRHKPVHDYTDIDGNRIWLVVAEDLPGLLKDIDLIVSSET